MAYNLREAGVATGKSTSTILRAVKSGLISANQTRRNAGWSIDPSELHRVFPSVGNLGTDVKSWKDDSSTIRQLETRITEKDDQINDLRRRLDLESEDRRKLQSENHALQAKLTAVLSDQRGSTATHDPIPVVKYEAPRSRWFKPWRRRSRP